MSDSRLSRRAFLASSAGLFTRRRAASDWVKLGHSGVKVTRLAFGTGTFSGRVQRELGQEGFNRLVRHAYDHGIRFFETADSYPGMAQMLGIALKGLPRDSFRLMTKMPNSAPNAAEMIDRFRRELQTDYIDILLLHCVRRESWVEDLERQRDAFSLAKQKGIIHAHGASCHGLLPLKRFAGAPWVDVGLFRVNHDGAKMDNLESKDGVPGNVQEVTERLAGIHKAGKGVLGMKLIGEGTFKSAEQRDAAMRYVMKLGTVDAVTIGYKSPAEIDEAIERMNRHLNG
jgi:predicted aldo/keto reductase-like oxidoreductase